MKLLRRIKYLVRYLIHFGSNRYCPVCEKSSRVFLRCGRPRRPDGKCPKCGSRERHRLAILFLREKTNLFDGRVKRFLHVAPELAFAPIFAKAAGDGYLSVDLLSENVMEKMDITDIKYSDESFDIIYCSHVLEHVSDDRKAMREFYRVLKPGGWAVLDVPITAKETFEDPSVTDPSERLRLFGQRDHVRRYGPDYADRLVEAGFQVKRFLPTDLLSDTDVVEYGLTNGDAVYHCTKL